MKKQYGGRLARRPYRFIAAVMVAAMLPALAGCGRSLPALEITGDCEGYHITAGMALEKAIAQAKPRAAEFDVLLMGNDGMVARISGDELDGCEVVYSKENPWEIKSELHPPSARVKDLARIAVVSVKEDVKAGQLLLPDSLYLLKEEGTSTKNNRSVTVYTTRLRIPLSGGENIEGLVAGLPELIITETAADALEALERGGRAMVIELDGLGWEMLQRAGEEYAPWLHPLGPGRALACYPPISNVGLAAMLTGAPPDRNGVLEREMREMKREDIFSKAMKLGKTCAYIEGSHALLNTSIKPVLSLDDGEAYENAREALAGGPDLMFAHFHGIDEAAHAYGPYAEQTMQKIREIDGYVRALMEGFDGRVIITADHGLHETEEGGGHGELLPEDMIVPYIVQ